MMISGVDITKRERTEGALRESEEKYRAIFNEALDGVVLLDFENGSVCDCNAEFERQTGRTLGELKKLRMWELRPPEKTEAARKKFIEIKEQGWGRSQDLEYRKPDGGITYIEFKSRVVTIGGRRYVQSISRDITEQRQSQELVRTAYDNSPLGIYILQDERLRYINAQFQRLTGYGEK
jgi:PAS domain S-box-containing protein